MSRYCLDCIGDCCCPSLEAEVERLRAEINRVAPFLAVHGVMGYSIEGVVPTPATAWTLVTPSTQTGGSQK